ncbi:unnamed protein product [Moneuplotes crassus]|uniref:Uncharacterized protein n=1 Tax=Euplotes crassus TaxID=5936 RepID=A0AAD2D046_EUPCR|nr:unnamed protein product [Moneuplotes crassus]
MRDWTVLCLANKSEDIINLSRQKCAILKNKQRGHAFCCFTKFSWKLLQDKLLVDTKQSFDKRINLRSCFFLIYIRRCGVINTLLCLRFYIKSFSNHYILSNYSILTQILPPKVPNKSNHLPELSYLLNNTYTTSKSLSNHLNNLPIPILPYTFPIALLYPLSSLYSSPTHLQSLPQLLPS